MLREIPNLSKLFVIDSKLMFYRIDTIFLTVWKSFHLQWLALLERTNAVFTVPVCVKCLMCVFPCCFQDRAFDDLDIYSSFSYPLLDGELTVSSLSSWFYITIAFFIALLKLLAINPFFPWWIYFFKCTASRKENSLPSSNFGQNYFSKLFEL